MPCGDAGAVDFRFLETELELNKYHQMSHIRRCEGACLDAKRRDPSGCDMIFAVKLSDDRRLVFKVSGQQDVSLPAVLELEQWVDCPPSLFELQEAIQLLGRDPAFFKRQVVCGCEPGEGEAGDGEERWMVKEDEPAFEEGWNAYRRELLETMGRTMLPVWEKLPEEVRESWCHGVRVAMREAKI